ncbi:DNA-directed RNA polymerase II RPB1 [Besnoitia besnoiti]|uniref:DNA-directed RNA polymerase subunit n=1 Tax=Besnoitia besnoiti TaxID=94643 RepID=A0A2A9MDF4_BESBE|nr:DNA-directed RNA polymerase II RPB1 [Besnoitia besnoiti]PFH35234.1 DNA-directed RNA polymerase II RPB1 [Besnoitia besnoiti]
MSSLSSSAALYSSAPLKRVDALQFGVFSSEQIRKMSVCEVTTSELYENGMPKPNGLNDLRLGTLDYRLQCRTCNMDVKNCPGHFGHLNLVKPVYHYGFLGAVLRVLRCVCYACGKLLVDRRDPKIQHLVKIRSPCRRLKHVLDACAGRKRCEGYMPLPADGAAPPAEGGEGGCGCVQPRYFKEGPNIVVLFPESRDEGDEDAPEDVRRIFAAEEAYAVLRRISEEDLKTMGFDPERAHPASFILSTLPVPPLAVRPSVQYGSARSEDDLTLKLVDIVKTNLSLKRQGDSVPSAVLQEMVMLLQYHVTTLFDNDIPGMPVATTRGKKPIKSIRTRLKGKEGRLRGNLMGKRVDFSARTVITGDPMLPIDTVGVPKSIAMTLTYPEFVTPLNINQLRQLVKTGPFDWPGAKYVIRDDGSRFDLRHAKKGGEVVLEVGYRVERHMRDGDFVLFNRQPSLHKMSIMGHQVKILPYSTFRLNLSVTSPYNADFDGDEMNLHLAQSEETRAEIKHLMKVPKQIVSPQGNKPVMGIVQDSLLAVSKFTRRDTFLTKPMVFNLLLQIPYWSGVVPPPAIFHPVPLWTGKQLFSLLLFFDSAGTGGSTKSRINMQRDVGAGLVDRKKENLFISERDERVVIRQGELLAGKICKKIVGSASGSLIHLLWLEAGPERTKDFLSTLQKLTNYWLLHQGFTVGCKDIIANEETNEKVRDILDQAKKEVDKLTRLAHRGRLESQPGKSLRESFEARVNKELNSARERSGKVAAESLDESNNIMAMVLAGSKGSTINISQIMACVGQQNVEGKRIPFGFNERSLPHFHKFDYSPPSRGFVENSYLSGLEPHELFFHAMGGREGIIDTACKTSETGYIQRRLMKAMEDVMVYYDRTVRNSICEVLQFLYGEDGMSGEYVEDQTVELMTLDNEKLKRLFRHDVDQESYGKGWLSDDMRNEILTDFELQQPLEEEFEAIREDKNRLCRHIFKDGETKQHIPINILRLLEFAKAQFPGGDQFRRQNPIEIARKVNELLNDKLVVVKQTTKADAISAEVQENATIFMKAHLRTVLNSRRLLERERVGPKALQWLLGEVERQFHRALAHAGECVGAIAAQSIGEPATQMTLNTFHFAGVGSKNVTLGVPRLKELINVAKQVKTPSLTVYLQDEIAMDQERAKDVQTHLEHTTLDRVTVMSQVIYDPDPTDTIIPQDRQWVRDYYEFPDDDELPNNLGRWLLRVQMASKVMIDKKLTMKEIGEKIYAEFPNEELDCIWTDDNSDDLVLRIRIKHQPGMGEGGEEEKDEDDVSEAEDRFLQKLMMQCLAGITLRGITNISKVYMREEARTVYNAQLGKFERTNNWVLDTDGCNLEDVLPIPMVDNTRTTSNDMTEIFHVLGIEAVRRALLRELRAVISFDGSYVNYRHLAILCDTMTQKGYLMSITRHGINRIDKGPLMKCSFEETVEILMEAAVFAETDHLKGVTENIMVGQLCPLGTGYFDVLIDEEKLKDASHNLDGVGLVGGDLDGFLGASPAGAASDPHLITPDGSFTPSPHQLNSVFSPMPFSTVYTSFATSPTNPLSPTALGGSNAAGVDTQQLGGKFSPTQQTPRSPTSPMSPLTCFSPRDPHSPLSPGAGPPGGVFSPTSPILGSALETSSLSYSPSSPQSAYFQGDGSSSSVDMVISPGGVDSDGSRVRGGSSYSPTSPTLSPSYSPSSPPSYSPTSPAYSPTSAVMSVTSPVDKGGRVMSPFSPGNNPMSPHFSASSPSYSPTSPVQQSNPTSPTSPYSPAYSPTSPRYSPTSPMYSPTFAPYSPQSPSYGGAPGQGPLSPSFNVQSPRYSPSSPAAYSPTSPMPNVNTSPSYDDAHAGGGGTYSPTSPMYEANDPFSPDPFAAEVVDEVGDEAALDSPTGDGNPVNEGDGAQA